MKNITKTIKIILIALFCFGFSFSLPLPSFAFDGNPCGEGVPAEVKAASGCNGEGSDRIASVVQGILNAIIAVSGLVAVVYIVIGGINYITSAGDTNKTQKARQTILYAVIGLVICALAFAIVNFTIDRINSNSQSQNEGQQESRQERTLIQQSQNIAKN